MFCTPKNADGRLDTAFQVIWMQCDSCQAAVSSAKVPHSLGLVRGRKTLGIRVKETDFEAAWQILCPTLPKPTKQAGEHVYRIDGTPIWSYAHHDGTMAPEDHMGCTAYEGLGAPVNAYPI